MAEGPKPKDWWDKLDIIGKLASGVILAAIAAVIKSGADNIATAQKEGDLVRQLISDLTSQNQQTRQDLALIALNHAVGKQNKALVTEIAERLVLDTVAYARGVATRGVAFRILEQHDSARADSARRTLLRGLETTVFADSAARASVRSSADTAGKAAPTSTGDSAARAVASVAAVVASASASVVYIQWKGGVTRAAMQQLRERLSRGGFLAPGVERVDAAFRSSVRYFHAPDSVLADSVARITRDFLRQARLPGTDSLPLQYIPVKRAIPSGQIEVWLSF